VNTLHELVALFIYHKFHLLPSLEETRAFFGFEVFFSGRFSRAAKSLPVKSRNFLPLFALDRQQIHKTS